MPNTSVVFTFLVAKFKFDNSCIVNWDFLMIFPQRALIKCREIEAEEAEEEDRKSAKNQLLNR